MFQIWPIPVRTRSQGATGDHSRAFVTHLAAAKRFATSSQLTVFHQALT